MKLQTKIYGCHSRDEMIEAYKKELGNDLDIIYDDRETIVKEWTKKGGIGMLVPYNSRRKEYIGEEK